MGDDRRAGLRYPADMRAPRMLAGLLLVTACRAPIDYTPIGGNPAPGPIGSESSGPDAGDAPDAGAEVACPADTDGASSGLPLVVGELRAGAPGYVELWNQGELAVDLETVSLDGPGLPSPGEGSLPPGASALVVGEVAASGELFLVVAGAREQYVCWGAPTLSSRHSEAIIAGKWSPLSQSQCAPAPTADRSLHLAGAGTLHTDWALGPPTPGGCPEP